MITLLLSLGLSGCSSDQGIGTIPSPPQVTLGSPGEVLRQGEGPVELLGTVADQHDAPQDLQITWQVGEDAPVEGSADSDGRCTLALDVDALPYGPHVVTLSARDSDGDQGSDQTSFEVWGPLGAPTVQILAPADGTAFAPGASITFQGQGSDAATDPDDLVFTWDSDLDGPLPGAISADGQSVLVTGALSTGLHQVTLTATDTDGEVGSDTIHVEVGEDEEPEREEPQDAEPGDLVFSEMMINPQVVADEVGEWVELYNTAGAPIEIQGYTFRDDDTDLWVLEGSMVVEPGDWFVLCADLDPGVNGGVPCDGWFYRNTETPGLALANNPDEVVLMRPDGTEIDWLHYDDTWYAPGVAIGVDPGFLDSGANDDPTHWCLQTSVLSSGGEPGTPGAENDACG